MKTLILHRFCYSPRGTFGSMIMPDGQHLYTVERQWNDNKPSVSCIPEGTYLCVPRRYHRGGYKAIEVLDVPNRSHILFHRANVAEELAGCIAPGLKLGWYKNQWAVMSSTLAFRKLMNAYGGQDFGLVITKHHAGVL